MRDARDAAAYFYYLLYFANEVEADVGGYRLRLVS